MVVPTGRPLSAALNASAALSGPVVWIGVVWPYAVDVPNWNATLARAPSGLTLPDTVAVVRPTPLAAPVTGASGWWASANRLSGLVPLVNRKNGVPSAPPWHVAPSALNGLAVHPDEIGSPPAVG